MRARFVWAGLARVAGGLRQPKGAGPAVQQFISNYGYLAIFVLMLAESACIPVPSELTMLFAGALSAARWPVRTSTWCWPSPRAWPAVTSPGAWAPTGAGRPGTAGAATFCSATTTSTGPAGGSTGMAARPCSPAAWCPWSARSSHCRGPGPDAAGALRHLYGPGLHSVDRGAGLDRAPGRQELGERRQCAARPQLCAGRAHWPAGDLRRHRAGTPPPRARRVGTATEQPVRLVPSCTWRPTCGVPCSSSRSR